MDAVSREVGAVHNADWTETQDRVILLYTQGKMREALEEANRAAQGFPNRLTRTSYWRACLLSILGETREALDALRDALSRGSWWSDVTLRNESDLASLRDLPEFQAILRECAAQCAAAAQESRPGMIVLEPDRVDDAALPPLLLALHSRGTTAGDFAPRWESGTGSGAVVAVPQSSQMCASDQHCWDDEARASEEVRKAYDKVVGERRVDKDRVVLAGASQGGRLAVRAALTGDLFPCRGFIVVVPALRDVSEFGVFLNAAARRGIRGYMVVGDNDSFYERACALHDAMKANGLQCFLDVRQGMGHRFPQDFAATLPRAMEFVLGAGSS